MGVKKEFKKIIFKILGNNFKKIIFFEPPKKYVEINDLHKNKQVNLEQKFKKEKFYYPSAKTIEPLIKIENFSEGEQIENEGFIAIFSNGIVCSDYGFVNIKNSDQNLLIKELSVGLTSKPFKEHFIHGIFQENQIYTKKYFNGNLGVLATTASSHNYYHFLIECVSRLKLLEKSNVPIDKYYVPYSQKYHKEILDFLGIKENMIVKSEKYSSIEAKKLIVPSLPFDYTTDKIKGHGQLKSFSSWGINFLKDKSSSIKAEQKRRIYISRSKAPKRKLINEKEITDILKDYKFETVVLEDLSFSEQVKFFKEAEVVIGLHGAGFANIVFCEPKATIIDIFSENYFCNYYKIISNKCSLDYYYFFGKNFEDSMDVIIEKDKLIKQLQMAGLKDD